MSELAKWWETQDKAFFKTHLDRTTHIRNAYHRECEAEFRKLGPHEQNRRRIIYWRLSIGHPLYNRFPNNLFKMPFLAFSDETIEDRDDILLPILHEIMVNARDNPQGY